MEMQCKQNDLQTVKKNNLVSDSFSHAWFSHGHWSAWNRPARVKTHFYPARIFMGDTGALFLGYMISVLALLGFKNVAIISFVIPIFILGVPIADTLIAIVRR